LWQQLLYVWLARLVLLMALLFTTGELAKHAVSEGTKAVTKYQISMQASGDAAEEDDDEEEDDDDDDGTEAKDANQGRSEE